MKRSNRRSATVGAFALLIIIATLFFVAPKTPDKSPDTLTEETPAPVNTQTSWQHTHSLNLPRRGLAAASNNKFVYAVGGMDAHGNYIAPVEVAEMHANGTLSEWRITSSLQEPRFYLAAAVVGNYLYAVGGANGPRGHENQPVATVEKAKIQPDGTLGPWQHDLNLTTARRGLQVVAIDNTLLAVGGYNGEFLRTAEHAVVNADGSLAPWTADAQSSNAERYIHSAAAVGRRVYLLAGHVQGQVGMSYGDVEMTELNTDGVLNRWRAQPSPLNRPRFLATAVATPTQLWLIGGHDGQQQLAHVEMASLGQDGSVGKWHSGPALNLSRSACAAVVANKMLLVIGGAHEDGPVASVEVLNNRLQ